jgi:hypothetical protein
MSYGTNMATTIQPRTWSLGEGHEDKRGSGPSRAVHFLFLFLFGWEKEGNASCTVAPKRRVWDSNRARQWA